MKDDYTILEVFEFSTEAQVIKSRLEAEGIDVLLMDEKTIDSDPLISQAIGGVKLLVHNKDFKNAQTIYNAVRTYSTDEEGNAINCTHCNSSQVLMAPLQRKNIFYMLFPFFEKTRHICNECKTVF